MSKKIIAILLALVLLLAMVPAALASDGIDVSVTASTTAPKQGETVTFTVSAKSAVAIGTLSFHLDIPDGMTFVAGSAKLLKTKADLGIDELSFTEASKYYIMVDASFEGKVPAGNYDLMTFECKVNDDADGKLPVGVIPEDALNEELEPVTFTSAPATVSVKVDCAHATTKTEGAKDATCTEAGYTGDTVCTACGETVEKGTVISAKGHTEVADEAVEATCTEAGKTAGSHCSVCGAVIVAQTDVEAKGHTEVIDAAVEATCTEAGKTEGAHCSVCDAVIKAQETIPAKGHTVVTDAAVEATCTEAGKTEGSHCAVCMDVLVEQEVVPAKGHTEVEDPAVPATCTESGKTAGVHCSVCETVIKSQETVPATGHSYPAGVSCDKESSCTVCGETKPAGNHAWGPESVITEATCTEKGVNSFTCTVCDATKTEEIDAKGHTVVIDAVVEPTCTDAGKTEGSHCSVCGDVIGAQSEIPAKGHTVVTDAGVEATCTKAGKTEGSHCSVCNNVLVAQEVIPAKGHTAVTDAAVEATCTEAGKTEGSHCSVCETVIKAQEVVPALGHDYDEGVEEVVTAPSCTEAGEAKVTKTCSRCKDTVVTTKTLDATGHAYGEAVIDVTKPATCTDDGEAVLTQTCANCKDTKVSRETVPALGHNLSEAAAKVEATCTTEGKEAVKECSRCDYTEGGAVIPMADHTPSADSKEEIKKEATCTEDGCKVVTGVCDVCGAELRAEEITIPALGHDWDEGKVTKEATTEAEGEKLYTCKNDASHTKTEVIEKLAPETKPEEKPETKPEDKPTQPSKPADPTVPSTGDNGTTVIAVCLILLAISGTAVVVLKKKVNE